MHGGGRAGYVDRPLLRYRVDGAGLTADRMTALRSRVQVLERAAALDLAPDERRVVDHFLRRRRRRAQLAEIEVAVAARAPGARRGAATAAFRLDVPLRLRGLLLAAALVPALGPRIGAYGGHRRG